MKTEDYEDLSDYDLGYKDGYHKGYAVAAIEVGISAIVAIVGIVAIFAKMWFQWMQ